MDHRTAPDSEYLEKETQRHFEPNGPTTTSRERTVRERIDKCIREHRTVIKVLEDLRDNLPASFLNSGESRVTGGLVS